MGINLREEELIALFFSSLQIVAVVHWGELQRSLCLFLWANEMSSERAATLRGIEILKEGTRVVFHSPLQGLKYSLCINLP